MDESTLQLQLEQLDSKQLRCTHCGLCNAACATYAATGWEHQGPRGRIRLAEELLHGRITPDSGTLSSFDDCLACGACERVCPEGVGYGEIRSAVQTLRRELAPDTGVRSDPTTDDVRQAAEFPRTGLRERLGSLFGQSKSRDLDSLDRHRYDRAGLSCIPEAIRELCDRLELGAPNSMTATAILDAVNQAKVPLELVAPLTVHHQRCCSSSGSDVRLLLKAIGGLDVRDVPLPEACCGGHAATMLLRPPHAAQCFAPKLEGLPTDAIIVVTSPDCAEVYAHHGFDVRHPAELVLSAMR